MIHDIKTLTLTAGVSEVFDTKTATIDSVVIETELTSTTFTLTCSREADGTFVSLKDPTGRYGAAGAATIFTVGSTSVGTHSFPPELVVGLSRFVKFNFDQSDAGAIYVNYRDFA